MAYQGSRKGGEGGAKGEANGGRAKGEAISLPCYHVVVQRKNLEKNPAIQGVHLNTI